MPTVHSTPTCSDDEDCKPSDKDLKPLDHCKPLLDEDRLLKIFPMSFNRDSKYYNRKGKPRQMQAAGWASNTELTLQTS